MGAACTCTGKLLPGRSSSRNSSTSFRHSYSTYALSARDVLKPRGVVKVGRRIGKGGGGCTVYEGQLGTLAIAVKLLKLDVATTRLHHKNNLQHEVDIIHTLHHPHVVRFLGFEEVTLPNTREARLCLELCGGTLRDTFNARKESSTLCTMDEAVTYACDVAKGLAYLHEENIIHRDLSSGNLFVVLQQAEDITSIRTVKIGDFDCAVRLDVARHPTSPTTTPNYMCPEMWLLEEYSYSADIWSYGMLVSLILTLTEPYGEDATLPEIERQALAGTFPHIDVQREQECSQLVAIAKNCIQVQASARPSCEELLHNLALIP
eukprot:NODE_854_length_1279_cov_286.819512_g650_i0.p1 GENE.NODE_854_length_1279_cov_286.819512_g650_i0~~NODE_854_length_1279_cov_286.819512_g650_i0.p1  ORF type:complete len:320 (+),score=40.30 NODE_854_length_1279_cov_286.819512_g650_i0:130-1089(+)